MLRLLAALTFSILAFLVTLAYLALAMLLPSQRDIVMLLPQQPRFLRLFFLLFDVVLRIVCRGRCPVAGLNVIIIADRTGHLVV